MRELTVVIPTLARKPEVLGRVIAGLHGQECGQSRFEVVVVVDAKAGDHAWIEKSAQKQGLEVRILKAEIAGASANRNLGWVAAGTPLILFLDDDVIPTPGLITEHLRRHGERPERETAVLGHVRWAPELRVTSFMRWLERGIQFDYQAIEGEDAGWGRFYTANASVKRELLERVGGFDERRLPYGYEDLDIAYRMSKLGLRLIYAREAIGDHLHPMDLQFWRRRIRRIAVSEREFVRIHPELRPYFYDLFRRTGGNGQARGRLARLAGLVPPGVPVLGPRVWLSADVYFRQQLAVPFMKAWEEAAGASSNSSACQAPSDSAPDPGSQPSPEP